ncbi:MAG: hypothetical protein E6K81_17030 [Candidatus Eisenbacteria bacterium]|uniref:Uncharacterized protein n=1 Tax=Eiseniibacteriota bacterium TaxID=2212470 RepID=A0A538TVQ8_UNCEI|nr:MAG: hypothetical protein E6K81_17030 [Candidatus Eisenbacteria bacterium]
MKRSMSHALALLALPLLLLTAGCKGGLTPIKTLLDDPGRFDHQTVRIGGTVKQGVGILGYGVYRLDDGTGTLTVVTKEGGSPREGAKIGAEGEFRSAFTLGTETAAVLVEKQRFTP